MPRTTRTTSPTLTRRRFARQAIAAARAADAAQDAGTHQLLHDLFQVAPGQTQASSDVLTLHRFGAAMIGDVGDRLERENQLL